MPVMPVMEDELSPARPSVADLANSNPSGIAWIITRSLLGSCAEQDLAVQLALLVASDLELPLSANARIALGFLMSKDGQASTPATDSPELADKVEALLKEARWAQSSGAAAELALLKRTDPALIAALPAGEQAQLIKQLSGNSMNVSDPSWIERLLQLRAEILAGRTQLAAELSLYLPDEIGSSDRLQNALAALAPESLESLCLSLDPEDLNALLARTPAESKERLQAAIPIALQTRLSAMARHNSDESSDKNLEESRFLRARAELLRRVRRA